jgi:hypothetical protein
MKARLGGPKAVTATAHKLARLYYRLVKHGEEYVRGWPEPKRSTEKKIRSRRREREAWALSPM